MYRNLMCVSLFSPTLHNLLPTLCYLLCCCLPSFMHCAHVYIYSYRAQQNTMQHIIASQVKQKAALAGNPHRRRSRIQQQQSLPAHKFLTISPTRWVKATRSKPLQEAGRKNTKLQKSEKHTLAPSSSQADPR